MKEFYNQNKNTVVVVIPIVLVFFLGGFFVGKNSISEIDKTVDVSNKTADTAVVDFAPFWKAWNVINEKYVPTASTTKKINDQARVWGAISGMTDSLNDPYTTFFPPVEAKNFEEQVSGNFEGVGMEVGIRDGIITVIAPIKDTPAYIAGVKSGDRILKVDNTPTNNFKVEEAIKLIKGPKGTEVKLTLLREGKKDPFVISIIRDIINMPTIDTEIKGDVFVIRLYNFSAISSNLFREALRKFIESGKTRLILDLRGNPGGYLESAVDMASWFLPMGNTIVKEDFRNDSDDYIFRSKGYNIFSDQLKMVILIDNGSASASEILAGALKENGIATLVGEKSFGKGSVQELIPITSDTSLKVTIARWLTPNGNSISQSGIMPDFVVKFDADKFVKGVDTQLDKAIEILDK